MIAMTYFSADAGLALSAVASYTAARPECDDDAGTRAFVRVNCVMEHGWLSVMLSIQGARELAEQLPGLVMDHDAAEHAAKEQAAARKAVAESKAA